MSKGMSVVNNDFLRTTVVHLPTCIFISFFTRSSTSDNNESAFD